MQVFQQNSCTLRYTAKRIFRNINRNVQFITQQLIDTVQQCTITGAQDASIRNVTPTDIPWLCAAAPIRRVLCNGAAAYSLCVKYHALPGVQVVKLPSTSPANAACRPEKLREVWGAALADWLINV